MASDGLWIILGLGGVWLLFLLLEAHMAQMARNRLPHIVHVNGTRGKSAVCRMIDAGLRAGGLRVLTKTTGTDPMTIDVEGREEMIHRRGKANIREQIRILKIAARQYAEILVIECMAIQPELQEVAQHRILRADIGVITNVRMDHMDVMGNSREEICDALCHTIPKGGKIFTAEQELTERMGKAAAGINCAFYPVKPEGGELDFDFPENIALAAAVCKALGVPEDVALAGMRNYHRDPYALSMYHLPGGSHVSRRAFDQ